MFRARIYPGFQQRLRSTVRRTHSNASTKYPYRNVRAYPFKVSPEDAITQMAALASLMTMFHKIWGSLGARFLPGFGFEPFRPTEIKPIYFPAWLIDAEVEADISFVNQGETLQRPAYAHFVDSYLPGNDYKILSLMSLWSKELQHTGTVPFSEDLETQHGQAVACLPYTISPFAILEHAKSLSQSDATVGETFRFVPNSLKANLLAAYPILIPLYLARYEFRLPGADHLSNVTLCMEAFSPRGRIIGERIGAEAGALLRKEVTNAPSMFLEFTHSLDGMSVLYLRGLPLSFTKIAGFGVAETSKSLDSHLAIQALGQWMDGYLKDMRTAKKLSELGGGAPKAGDVRVREYSVDETKRNRSWMAKSTEIFRMETMFKNVTDMERTSPDSHYLEIQKTVDLLRKQHPELRPSWWKEWKDGDESGRSDKI